MNMSGGPANCWLLCMLYVCYILNHIACGALNGSTPLLVLYGITPDISIMLLYTFYQRRFYATHDQHFPSESEEQPFGHTQHKKCFKFNDHSKNVIPSLTIFIVFLVCFLCV